jgi:hypothetical protein
MQKSDAVEQFTDMCHGEKNDITTADGRTHYEDSGLYGRVSVPLLIILHRKMYLNIYIYIYIYMLYYNKYKMNLILQEKTHTLPHNSTQLTFTIIYLCLFTIY